MIELSRSGESRFNLSSDNNRVRVWRPHAECLNPAFALQRHIAPAASEMVWGAIAYNTWSLRGNMTTQWYVHDILQPHVLPLMQRLTQKPFFNKTMLGLTRQGCHKTVSTLLLLFLGLRDSQIRLQSFEMASCASHGFERTRGKLTANMERNISRHHTELYISMPDGIASCIRARGVQQGIKSSVLLPFL
ncbi:transposable element Tcb2 transposase [Trichonephila clavipes]|nr:transposable element Tcb2 transposase [Trichonephila clavipes]